MRLHTWLEVAVCVACHVHRLQLSRNLDDHLHCGHEPEAVVQIYNHA